MASKNDKWSLFKNYLHNELGITKVDIREWLEEAVREEARKLIADSFKSYDIRDRIDDAIKECMQIISDITNYTSIVLGSKSDKNILKQTKTSVL